MAKAAASISPSRSGCPTPAPCAAVHHRLTQPQWPVSVGALAALGVAGDVVVLTANRLVLDRDESYTVVPKHGDAWPLARHERPDRVSGPPTWDRARPVTVDSGQKQATATWIPPPEGGILVVGKLGGGAGRWSDGECWVVQAVMRRVG